MLLDHGPCELPCQRFSAIQKKIGVGTLSVLSLDGVVTLQPVNCAFPDGDASLLAAFAMTDHYSGVNVYVSTFHQHQFRDPQSRGIHQLQHCSIAYSLLRRDVGSSKQSINFVLGQKLWQVRKLLRRVEIFGGLVRDM